MPKDSRQKSKSRGRTSEARDQTSDAGSRHHSPLTNAIHLSDCIAGMDRLEAGSVDLAFADPPFNIGYEYDVYNDSREYREYLDWSSQWIAAVHRVLKPDGTFWLAIGDEFAAELKLESRKLGFHCRSWVIWYYTFGVHCSKKFTRSHAHLFYFVKDPKKFTFLDADVRVPSARELVYNDKRANPAGRMPDDTWMIRPADCVGEMVADEFETWPEVGGQRSEDSETKAESGKRKAESPREPSTINPVTSHHSPLTTHQTRNPQSAIHNPQSVAPPSDDDRTYVLRPQDLSDSFQPTEDTWYFPRVAGTFKERTGFHGCQMPEQLLGRIIRACSNPGELVLDPFSGSATTLAVAKKLGRRFIGFDVSESYIDFGTSRLESIRVGDPLDGSAEPLKSAPKTGRGRNAKSESRNPKQIRSTKLQSGGAIDGGVSDVRNSNFAASLVSRELTERGVIEAFAQTHDGFSADRVVADPDLNREFAGACERLGLVGDARMWNTLLFRLRKAGELSHVSTTRHTSMSWEDCDPYLFASEIALQQMIDAGDAASLDEILCDPALAGKFDQRAATLAPDDTPLEYRWAALKLRKQARLAIQRADLLDPPRRLGNRLPVDDFHPADLPAGPGLYLVGDKTQKLYVGETLNLRTRLELQFADEQLATWHDFSPELTLRTLPLHQSNAGRLAWQSCLVKRCGERPRLNYFGLGVVS